MYIEVVHDQQGNIKVCYCIDTMPVESGVKFFTLNDGLPAGGEQTRVNIDTLHAMEIDAACGQKAQLNPDTGLPEIVEVDRATYIKDNFLVDMAQEFIPPAGVAIPEGMKIRGLVTK